MAKTKNKEIEEVQGSKAIRVIALVNIKYDNNCYKIKDEFNVRIEDLKEMNENGFIEILDSLDENIVEEELRESE